MTDRGKETWIKAKGKRQKTNDKRERANDKSQITNVKRLENGPKAQCLKPKV